MISSGKGRAAEGVGSELRGVLEEAGGMKLPSVCGVLQGV